MSESAGRVGILIIGSLYWCSRSHRDIWRRDRLDQYRARYVRVPIRYGRLSGKTGKKSYTMVFSTSLGADNYGRAIVVPCSRRVRDAADVVDEAVHLWTAETSYGQNPKCRISEVWGCVGLLPNPQRPLPADLRAGWTKKVDDEQGYGKLKAAADENAAVDKSGFLTIPWPESEDGSCLEVDVLLAAATEPTIDDKGHYPTVQKIADAWNSPAEKKLVGYFYKNRKHDIMTFQDKDIADLLPRTEPGT